MISKEMIEAAARAMAELECGDEWKACGLESREAYIADVAEMYRDRAEAALAAALSSQWRGMESAPERTLILVCNPPDGPLPVIAQRNGDTWFWGPLEELTPAPTHWMPLPSPPEEKAASGVAKPLAERE